MLCRSYPRRGLCFAVTRLPGVFRASPEQAILFLTDIEDHLRIVSLDSVEYLTTIREASAGKGIVGATIYDALLAACAVKARGGDYLYRQREALPHVRPRSCRPSYETLAVKSKKKKKKSALMGDMTAL